MAETELSPSAKLCLSCGLCCNGALFPHAYFVFGENLSHWEKRGFDLVEEDGSIFFELGCPHLDGAACTIYDKPRPHTCGGFRCKPLQALEEGEIELDHAMSTIAEGVALAKAVRSEARRAGKAFKARNFFALESLLDDAEREGADEENDVIRTTRAHLKAFDTYADTHILPDHVLEERDQDNSA